MKAAAIGILSHKEIASRARIPEWKAKEILRELEQQHFLSRGRLMPVDLEVYRLTPYGEAALEKGDSI